MPEQRVVHITIERCGSQWVRDLLTRREIIGGSGLSYSGVTLNMSSRRDFEAPANTFSGPIYNLNQWEWRYWRKPGDLAIVVLRDPRDILVSLLFAWLCSHSLDSNIQFVRRKLAELPTDDERLTYVMGSIGPYQRMLWSWSADLDASALLVRYEDLVADPMNGFGRVIDWLGWKVGPDALRTAVDELSFESRVGRQRGQENVYSHHRRGQPGDWRNHFTREHGCLWESLYPGMLSAVGYERNNDWWRDLPEVVGHESTAPADHATALAAALQNRNAHLERELEAKERVIRELAAACDERLAALLEKERMIQQLSATCEQRLAVIQGTAGPAAERAGLATTAAP